MTGQWSVINISSSFNYSSMNLAQFSKNANKHSKCDSERSELIKDSAQGKNPGPSIHSWGPRMLIWSIKQIFQIKYIVHWWNMFLSVTILCHDEIVLLYPRLWCLTSLLCDPATAIRSKTYDPTLGREGKEKGY